MENTGNTGNTDNAGEISQRVRLTPELFQNKHEKQLLKREKERKFQKLRRRLARDPNDTIGKTPDGWFSCFQGEQGDEDLPGVSNRTSTHILTVTDDEIKEDTLKSQEFINRYCEAYDDDENLYSIWSLVESQKRTGSYYPDSITIENLERDNKNFEKHIKQIRGQMSLDASKRHGDAKRSRKKIKLTGLYLSAFSSIMGAIAAFMNDGSATSTQRITELGYVQVFVGMLVSLIIQRMSYMEEEHTKAARNLDVTLTWVNAEATRLKKELLDLQEPYLKKLQGLHQVEEKLPPIAQHLSDMKYIWPQMKISSPNRSLVESFIFLQKALFGLTETLSAVEKILDDAKAKLYGRNAGLFGSGSLRGSKQEVHILAEVYKLTFLLISEQPFSNELYYDIINEPLSIKHRVVDGPKLKKIHEGSEEESEEHDVGLTLDEPESKTKSALKYDIESGPSVELKSAEEPPERYMVFYMKDKVQYQPILAPMGKTWYQLKAGLESLPSALSIISSDSRESLEL